MNLVLAHLISVATLLIGGILFGGLAVYFYQKLRVQTGIWEPLILRLTVAWSILAGVFCVGYGAYSLYDPTHLTRRGRVMLIMRDIVETTAPYWWITTILLGAVVAVGGVFVIAYYSCKKEVVNGTASTELHYIWAMAVLFGGAMIISIGIMMLLLELPQSWLAGLS